MQCKAFNEFHISITWTEKFCC